MPVTPGLSAGEPDAGLSARSQALWRSAAELRRRADDTARLAPARPQPLGDAR